MLKPLASTSTFVIRRILTFDMAPPHVPGRRGRATNFVSRIVPGEFDLNEYKLKVTKFTVAEPDSTIDTIEHDESSGLTAGYAGTWARKGKIGEGACGAVFLERNIATGTMRAVKQLTASGVTWQERELKCMVLVKDVNTCPVCLMMYTG